MLAPGNVASITGTTRWFRNVEPFGSTRCGRLAFVVVHNREVNRGGLRAPVAFLTLLLMALPLATDLATVIHVVEHELAGEEHDAFGVPASVHGHGHAEGTPDHVHGSALPSGGSRLDMPAAPTVAYFPLPTPASPVSFVAVRQSSSPSPPQVTKHILRV